MRILLWYWGRRGGGAQFALGLAGALAACPDIRLRLSLSAQSEMLTGFRAPGVPVDIVQTYRDLPGFVTSLSRIPVRRRALLHAASGADVVVSAMTHLWTPLVAPGLARAGIPFVPVVHDALPHPGDPALFWDWRLGRELAAARAAVALSDGVAAALARRAPGLPILRMPLPALLAAAPPPAPPADGPPRFVFFGRLKPYKGLDLLRDAFRLLRARHPEALLRVVGEGNAEAAAPGLAALPGVTLEARWVAEDEIPALLAGATAVVLPYREASQSGVAPQALALGVPVVATPVGGLVEQVRPGAGGVLAAAVTPEALAEAMASLLVPGAALALHNQALQAARTAPGWAEAAAALLAGLASVLPAPRPGAWPAAPG